MDDFLIAFGALWVVICVYAVLAHHFRSPEYNAISSVEIPRWTDAVAAMPSLTVSASGSSHRREPRGSSRRRLQSCATRSTENARSSGK
jgi:hypothetical protein